jgi:hypothetical protein
MPSGWFAWVTEAFKPMTGMAVSEMRGNDDSPFLTRSALRGIGDGRRCDEGQQQDSEYEFHVLNLTLFALMRARALAIRTAPAKYWSMNMACVHIMVSSLP